MRDAALPKSHRQHLPRRQTYPIRDPDLPSLEPMRYFPALLLSLALVLTGGLLAPAPAEPGGPTGPADPDDPRTWQTSDRVPGRIAPDVATTRALSDTLQRQWWYDAAPGVRVSKWIDHGPRGRVRFYLVRTWWNHKGVTIDYAHPPTVKPTEPLGRMLRRTPDVVAGINGDFFDIGDTGAPLGLGRARGEGLINGIDYGWNSAFWINRKTGVPHVDLLNMKAVVKGRNITITNFNSPQVKPNGIGVYGKRWGNASGVRWVDGATRYARVVHVVKRKVVANGTTFPTGSFKGYYLVARGEKQRRQLRRLKVGTTVATRAWLPKNPAMAITGNAILLKDGKRQVSDDRELHPRTAVGVDRDKKQVLFVVVDGRKKLTRGYTMVELAKLMRHLGAEDALNLDGGGSSTLITRKNGRLGVRNVPSDGAQRSIANGLQVTYTAPKKKGKRGGNGR